MFAAQDSSLQQGQWCLQPRQEASQLQHSSVLSFISEVFKVHEMCFEFC